MLIGFESLNPLTLEKMGKSWGTLSRSYSESIGILRDHGISLYSTFVFGYDDDTPGDITRTVDFALKEKFALAAFNHLVPFPGTPIYERLKNEEKLLDNEWWLNDNLQFGDVVFKPKNFEPAQLAEACFNARTEFYKFSNFIPRITDFKANSKSILNFMHLSWVNLFSGKEAKRRQGWPIGRVE